MSDDPYAALGVARDATEEEIKKAYKRIAREAHPDLNPGDPDAAARFKNAANAYDLLKDPDKRTRFDHGEIGAAGHQRPSTASIGSMPKPRAALTTPRGALRTLPTLGTSSKISSAADARGERARG